MGIGPKREIEDELSLLAGHLHMLLFARKDASYK